jgi:hypothetical protein
MLWISSLKSFESIIAKDVKRNNYIITENVAIYCAAPT